MLRRAVHAYDKAALDIERKLTKLITSMKWFVWDRTHLAARTALSQCALSRLACVDKEHLR